MSGPRKPGSIGDEDSRSSSAPSVPTIALILALLIVSGLNSSHPSFDRVIAVAKLGIGLLHLIGIGWAVSKLLSLASPRHLACASHALLGQIVALGYVYMRSALSSMLGVPGIFVPEVVLVEGLLLWLVVRRGQLPDARPRLPGRSDLPKLIAHGLWLSWLALVAVQKLDLHYTPSSDPDIHAFYAKVLLERGHLYYDLQPFSDAWMVYPSGFSCSNFVLGLLSGLHPVQLVNIGPYFQFTLFCGATFSFIGQSIKGRWEAVVLAFFHFCIAYLCFNPVFAPNRDFLQGSPRLAHTAILFFPLLFTMQHAKHLGKRPLLIALPLCATLTGMCVNPTHVPATLLVAASAVVALTANPRTRHDIASLGASRWARVAILLGALAIVFLATDPFYRSLVVQQSAPEGHVEEARDLTGNALRADLDWKAITSEAVPRMRYKILANPGNSGGTVPVQVALLIGLLAWVVAAVSSERLGFRPSSPELRELLLFVALVFCCVALHAVWSELTPHLARPGVLQSQLLVRYSQALQYQLSTLLYPVCFTSALVLSLGFASGDGESGRRLLPRLIGLTLSGASLIWLVPASLVQAEDYYPKLRDSSLGQVFASDIEFVRRAQQEIGLEERALLPGRRRQTRNEHWIFTTGAGRAVPLFSDIRTSFFLGLDGWAFTAGAYQVHVEGNQFDPDWLRSHNVLWLVDSGDFPQRILKRHYDRVFGDHHAVLWRLRPQPH
jgi:hypothetical protein